MNLKFTKLIADGIGAKKLVPWFGSSDTWYTRSNGYGSRHRCGRPKGHRGWCRCTIPVVDRLCGVAWTSGSRVPARARKTRRA